MELEVRGIVVVVFYFIILRKILKIKKKNKIIHFFLYVFALVYTSFRLKVKNMEWE